MLSCHGNNVFRKRTAAHTRWKVANTVIGRMSRKDNLPDAFGMSVTSPCKLTVGTTPTDSM
eukprot:8878905-Prorocentrum_lima.AAC.1